MVLRQVRALLRRRRGGHKTKARAVSAGGVATDDVEVARLPKKRLQRNALHGMADDDDEEEDAEEDYDDEWDPDDEDEEENLMNGKSLSAQNVESVVEDRMNALTQQQRDQEKANKTMAMKKLVKAKSIRVFNTILEVYVDEDWQKDDAIGGNIYRMSAWGAFRGHKFMKKVKNCEISGFLKEVTVFLGVIFVGAIQILGAPVYFLTTVTGYGIDQEEKVDLLNWGKAMQKNMTSHPTDWDDEWDDYLPVKLFALLFLFAFIINATFVILTEKESWDKLNRVRFFLQHVGDRLRDVKMIWMYLGCFVNCWVVLWCTLDVWLVCAKAKTVKDVLYDGLGLLFLYNLDDIGGDLGFFADEDWKGAELAWVYGQIQEFLKEEDASVKWEDVKTHQNCFANICYSMTIVIMIVFVFLLPIAHWTVPVICLTGETITTIA